jgi:GAF domain-containing protein
MDSPNRLQNWMRGLRVLTDSSLAGLGLDDLLTELLDRVRKILNADTAAILLLDKESQSLVARAASGIEEEVYQNVHVPIGMASPDGSPRRNARPCFRGSTAGR